MPDDTYNETYEDEDFSADFPKATFDRLRADFENVTGDESSAYNEDKDIGELWEEQEEISRLEAMRLRAQDAISKGLPAWRRTMYKASTILHEAATKDGTEPPPTKEPATSSPVTKTVEIKVSFAGLPKLPSPATIKHASLSALKRIPRDAFIIAGGAIVAVAIIVFGVRMLMPQADPNPGLPATANGTPLRPARNVSGELAQGAPSYGTILPVGKDIKSLGGWTRVSPPDRNPVYAFVDKVGAIPINVSEQPLPEEFKADTGNQVAKLAQSYKASAKLDINGTIVWIGNSAKGPQSVIFTDSKLLILIKATAPVSNDQWAGYISSLK